MPDQEIYVEKDADQIAEEAYKEQDAEEKGGAAPEKPEEKPTEPSEEKPEEESSEPSKEEEPSEEEKATQEKEKEAKEAEEAENKKLLETNDEDLDDEQKAKKAELIKAEEDKKSEPPEEEVIREHALKNNLTLEEAKKDIDENKGVVEKYKGNPVELARALRHTQSAYDQLKSKEGKPQVVIQKDPTEEIRTFADKNKDKIISNYRTKFPAKSENMTDEAILEESVAQAERDFEIWRKEEKIKIANNASQKREQLLTSIPEADKRFIPDVKALLSRTPDHEVADESFDIKDLIYYARGSYYTPERIKALEDAAFKRGREKPKILGTVDSGSTGGSTTPKKGGFSGTGLNADQKARAIEMFPAEDGYSDDKAYKEYIDTYKEELKKDKNFLG